MAGKLNLTIEQGATFTKRLTWKAGSPSAPVDLSGCTARMQVRAKISDTAVLLELTTENDGITLGDEAGTIDLSVTAEQSAAITWKGGVYDLEIEFADGVVKRLVEGSITVSPEVTR